MNRPFGILYISTERGIGGFGGYRSEGENEMKSMRRVSSEVRGQGTGAIIIALMGSVWAAIGLNGHRAELLLMLSIPLALVILGIRFIRTGNRLRGSEPPATEMQTALEDSIQKRFLWVFAGEGIAIFLAVNVLANLGRSALLIPTIGVIVGLHFMPLAKLYGRQVFYWSGGIQILFCLAVGFALRSDTARLNMITGLGMAMLLWVTMFAVLFEVWTESKSVPRV